MDHGELLLCDHLQQGDGPPPLNLDLSARGLAGRHDASRDIWGSGGVTPEAKELAKRRRPVPA